MRLCRRSIAAERRRTLRVPEKLRRSGCAKNTGKGENTPFPCFLVFAVVIVKGFYSKKPARGTRGHGFVQPFLVRFWVRGYLFCTYFLHSPRQTRGASPRNFVLRGLCKRAAWAVQAVFWACFRPDPAVPGKGAEPKRERCT